MNTNKGSREIQGPKRAEFPDNFKLSVKFRKVATNMSAKQVKGVANVKLKIVKSVESVAVKK